MRSIQRRGPNDHRDTFALVVLAAIPQEKYWVSLTFAALFVWLSDPGGPFRSRLTPLAEFAGIGALLTALGYEVGSAAWGWVVVVAFAVTLVGGAVGQARPAQLHLRVLLNVWFLIALSQSVVVHVAHVDTTAGAQTLAWLTGSGVAIAYKSAGSGIVARVVRSSSRNDRLCSMILVSLSSPSTSSDASSCSQTESKLTSRERASS